MPVESGNDISSLWFLGNEVLILHDPPFLLSERVTSGRWCWFERLQVSLDIRDLLGTQAFLPSRHIPSSL